MGTPKDSEKTRAKIMEAAGILFAERGFKRVTVRDIAKHADTHLSALNYHFRTKESLYREALLEAGRSSSITEEDRRALEDLPPDEALFNLVRVALCDLWTADKWQPDLLTREIWEPSEAFEEVIETYYKPDLRFLGGLIGAVVDKPAEDLRVRFAVMAMSTLIDMFGHYDHLIEAVDPELAENCRNSKRIAKWIVTMTIAAAGEAKEQ